MSKDKNPRDKKNICAKVKRTTALLIKEVAEEIKKSNSKGLIGHI